MKRLDRAELDAAISAGFVEALQRQTPGLVATPAALLQMRVRGAGVITRTHARLGAPPQEAATAPWQPPSASAAEVPSAEVGRQRARAGVHPSQSLIAASCLFRVALPRLLAHYRDTPPEAVAVALDASIDDLLMAAAVTYVEVLLERVSEANLEERRRVARDLHDRTSHGIGAAMQGVDLALHVLRSGGEPDHARLAATRQVLLDTLNDVRDLATRLRDTVGARGLAQSLREHLEQVAPEGLTVAVVQEGADDAEVLPGYVKEEAYLVLREAVRNALAHDSAKTRLDVTVSVRAGVLRAVVADDGAGFDPDAVDTTRSLGLSSMRERAEGLGGGVALETAPGRGVRVVLTVPFGGAGS